MQRLKLRIEESGEKLSAAYAPPKWSETAGKGKGNSINVLSVGQTKRQKYKIMETQVSWPKYKIEDWFYCH